MEISDELDARFSPPPLWLEERIREALSEPAEDVTMNEFHAKMKAITAGH
jgi:hypothetical protein